MLDALRFVQGAVAKRDFVPALTHFRITAGEIKGYNGTLALRSPIAIDLEATPKALPFIKAIQTCDETASLHLTPKGKLAVASGRFRAYIDCLNDPYPSVEPEGELIELEPGLHNVMETLLPFVSEDASRPWSRGILFQGQSAFATNNVTLVQYWMPAVCPVVVNVPRAAVVELARIGEDPIALQATASNITFHFPGDRWLRTQAYNSEWPNLVPILDQDLTACPELTEDFWLAVNELAPFVDDTGGLYLANGLITTSLIEGEGAQAEVPGLVADGRFNVEYLKLLEGVATHASLVARSPGALFFGPNLRGAIAAMRTA